MNSAEEQDRFLEICENEDLSTLKLFLQLKLHFKVTQPQALTGTISKNTLGKK